MPVPWRLARVRQRGSTCAPPRGGTKGCVWAGVPYSWSCTTYPPSWKNADMPTEFFPECGGSTGCVTLVFPSTAAVDGSRTPKRPRHPAHRIRGGLRSRKLDIDPISTLTHTRPMGAGIGLPLQRPTPLTPLLAVLKAVRQSQWQSHGSRLG